MTTVIDDIETRRRLAANLRRELDVRGISQNQLAATAGEDPMTVSRVLRGITDPRTSTLARIAEALNLSVDDLLEPISESSRIPA